jgi:hypothetical protein
MNVSRQNKTLGFVATALLMLGIVAIYFPQLLQQNLPSKISSYLSNYSWLAFAMLVSGATLHLLVIIFKLKSNRKINVSSFANLEDESKAHASGSASAPTQVTSPRVGVMATAGIRSTSSLNTVKLVRVNQDTMAIKITRRSLVMLANLLIFGIAASGSISAQMIHNQSLDTVMLPLAVSALFFVVVGAFSLYQLARPLVFNRDNGNFGHGRNRLTLPLSRVEALQMVSKDSGGYELNLVLTDGSRITVMEQGCHESLAEDARTLSDFLGVSLKCF